MVDYFIVKLCIYRRWILVKKNKLNPSSNSKHSPNSNSKPNPTKEYL
jgi:hypothetical protein